MPGEEGRRGQHRRHGGVGEEAAGLSSMMETETAVPSGPAALRSPAVAVGRGSPRLSGIPPPRRREGRCPDSGPGPVPTRQGRRQTDEGAAAWISPSSSGMATIRDKRGYCPSFPFRQGGGDALARLQIRGERDGSCFSLRNFAYLCWVLPNIDPEIGPLFPCRPLRRLGSEHHRFGIGRQNYAQCFGREVENGGISSKNRGENGPRQPSLP